MYWFVSAMSVKKSVRNNKWWQGTSFRLAIIIFVILTFHVPVFGHHFLNTSSGISYLNPIIESFGVVLCALGIALAIWARVYLGRNWGMPMTLREKPELITTGPYSVIRHPIYTGILLAVLGSAFSSSIVWLIPFVLIAIYFIYSLRIEEKDMMQQFPKEYGQYKKRTKALIPFVY